MEGLVQKVKNIVNFYNEVGFIHGHLNVDDETVNFRWQRQGLNSMAAKDNCITILAVLQKIILTVVTVRIDDVIEEVDIVG